MSVLVLLGVVLVLGVAWYVVSVIVTARRDDRAEREYRTRMRARYGIMPPSTWYSDPATFEPYTWKAGPGYYITHEPDNPPDDAA